MNELQIFNNPAFGKVRGLEIDGEPWLVGKDVAEALGYANPSKAVIDHVDKEDKHTEVLAYSQNGNTVGKLVLINESGLYSLVLSSKLPGAKQFRRWVTSEVLPSLRKHGGYIMGQEDMSAEELLCRAVLYAQSKIEEQNRTIQLQDEVIETQRKSLSALEEERERNAPKVAFAERVGSAKGSISMGNFANLLFEKGGCEIGRNRLFRLLREKGYLQQNNAPYQKWLDAGYFVTRDVEKNGYVYPVTRVTGKGQEKLFHLITQGA